MIYTIGHRENYLKAISESFEGTIWKCPGGYAFLTYADAQRAIDEFGENRWCVWGLHADWSTDTLPAKNGWWRLLKREAQIIPLGTAYLPVNGQSDVSELSYAEDIYPCPDASVHQIQDGSVIEPEDGHIWSVTIGFDNLNWASVHIMMRNRSWLWLAKRPFEIHSWRASEDE